ncbi:MAG: 6-phosphogluconolactonase [Armatimonadota bacterium]|nr:6-phosphogluconolactonase [Armatimonadota bacterium]MDR7440433.1 6-phosphogluconolactonase [Armatimonadota bacterium]MDR7443965.1 6-phosphogluconolactonase [Armatimonadota bacterium]MDR7570063.1 6-phosphogluconolactonase [Armatimonadota bacterium]MDR7615432.1 6-phosphogluconolactonase [Armatimonadota bacterium]
MKRELRMYPDPQTLSAAAAEELGAFLETTASERGRCIVALAGGRTPRPVYERLAADPRIPWPQVVVFWGDERYVPPDDPRSNARMAYEALLGRVPIPPENVYPMPTRFEQPDEAARAYESVLRAAFCDPPRFDLVLLGMGADGHVASLFPGSPALLETERWVVAVRVTADPPVRLTLTLPVINRARRVDVLVTGAEKREAVRRALVEPPDPWSCPAGGVHPEGGLLVWWVDRAAAGGIPQTQRE